ncbi:MAG: hypothetical protein ACFB21_12040 [Opitutales bacterium]
MAEPKLHQLTEAQLAKLEPWVEECRKGAFRTQADLQVTYSDIREAVLRYYAQCGFEPLEPRCILIVRSPAEAVLTTAEIAIEMSQHHRDKRFGLVIEDLEPLKSLQPHGLIEAWSQEVRRRYPWSPPQARFHHASEPSDHLQQILFQGINWLENRLFGSATGPWHSAFSYPETVLERIEQIRPKSLIPSVNSVWMPPLHRLLCHLNTASLLHCMFLRDVLELDMNIPGLDYVALLFKNVGPGYQMRGTVILSELPVECRSDDKLRLHCSTGPAIRWADGTAIYARHGTPQYQGALPRERAKRSAPP